MKTDRIHIDIMFGTLMEKGLVEPHINKVMERLNYSFGGCYLHATGKGGWMDSIQQSLVEDSYKITVSIEGSLEEKMKAIHYACEPMKEIGCDWVHVEAYEVKQFHFQL